ncbi:MAG: hypothetical protein WCH21_03495 [Bacteroidota bacterium]
MKKIIILCFSLSLAFIFFNCKKNTTTTPNVYASSCSGTKSFLTNVSPLIQSNCVSCHSSYSTYAGVKSASSSIRSSIVNGSMPKGGSLTDDQKNNIVCWIDAGALNN